MTDAKTLTAALKGKWYRTYGLALCPAHGDRKPSLSLADAPDGRLLLNCKTGCQFMDILKALRDRGLLKGRSSTYAPDPVEIARRESKAEQIAAQTERKAKATWHEAQSIAGTVAETYLRDRGITCDLPQSLRFHPECWHPTAKRYPAMIARIDGLPRLAIHRTYLRPDGSAKACVDPPKAMQGAAKGGAVRLAEADGPLVVAEGIETALSLACGLLTGPATIWAALSCSGIAGLRLPDQSHSELVVASDGDDAGRDAAQKLAQRACDLGWKVSLLPAPQGRDWNDILTMKGAEA
ncbi:DUF7146 domain-containing protein [Paracoccus saliphilus]|uniref:Toprim domain-containing protein n=1 Tax=Paracoccus saliphilus TaxID=405559 RepID=A0AA45W1R6_9RHOB|nr:toprim domain-containing protein [Paracoccus saliphilus]WCR03754.1 toprim domain-containing protein [Paracoccus saliphilus]SIS59016.1 Toprim domain-containing protein [Paracoccus saliphilus]